MKSEKERKWWELKEKIFCRRLQMTCTHLYTCMTDANIVCEVTTTFEPFLVTHCKKKTTKNENVILHV